MEGSNMKIGLMGFDFSSANKGCEALSYSFVNMLSELIPNNLEIHAFGYAPLGNFPKNYTNIKFVQHRVKMKNPMYWKTLKHEFSKCDCIFDVTYGDGFSDIYGAVWNANTDMQKQIANLSSAPLVLLPQTYGPYKNPLLKRWAINIIKKSALCFSRDALSAQEMKKLGCTNIIPTTDLAFALPFDKQMFSFNNDKKKIGINISSLLWNNWDSNIKLTTDYKKYCNEIISYCTELNDTEVHLIPHVIDSKNLDSVENDSKVCKLLHEKYPSTILAPDFNSPIEAKSYISNMDIFLGARMHDSIAAISSNVATIPFSYSKKFEGLFGSLEYPYVISATKISTDNAISLTKKYITEYNVLKDVGMSSVSDVMDKLDIVKCEITKILNQKSGSLNYERRKVLH